MTFRDPKLARYNRVHVSFNDYEIEWLETLLHESGGELARLVHGLLIELKRRDATPCRLSANQKGFIEFQRAQGYRAEWCKGWDAARNLVINYLEGKLCQA